MKLAVMQPYIFPYIGYFQLIRSVDKFVFLDDVNFIKRGWINRNRILLGEKSFLFTIPLNKISQHTPINQTEISHDTDWQSKLLKTFEQAYKKAPQFMPVMEIISPILRGKYKYISELAVSSVKAVSNYLTIETKFTDSSEIYRNNELKGENRIIDICLKEKTSIYINAAGGRELYEPENFDRKGIELRFINSAPCIYRQFGMDFQSNLSIIDVLMFNERDDVRNFLGNYTLL